MKRPPRYKLTCGVLLLIFFGLFYAAIRLADSSLLGAGGRLIAPSNGLCLWSSDREIIDLHSSDGSPLSKTTGLTDESDAPPTITLKADRININDHSRFAWPPFKPRLPSVPPLDIAKLRISPDGQRLLYSRSRSEVDAYYHRPNLCVVDLRDGSVQDIDGEFNVGLNYFTSDAVWMRDNKQLVIAYDAEHNLAALLNTETGDDTAATVHLQERFAQILGVTPDNRLLYTTCFEDYASGSVYQVGIYPSEAALKKFKPVLPGGGTLEELSLSPKGDKLAWTIRIVHTPPLYNLLKRIAPRLATRVAPRPVIAIYLSDLDGSHMRVLGMEDALNSEPHEEVHNVCWRPDGKYLSYRWRNGIYAIDVVNR